MANTRIEFTDQDRATARLSGSNAADRDHQEGQDLQDEAFAHFGFALKEKEIIQEDKAMGLTPEWRNLNGFYWRHGYVLRATELLAEGM